MQLEDVWDDDRGLVFRYQVQAEDRDDNGISVAADALKLDGATIQDSGGNDAELDLGEHAISNDGDHKVDGSIDHPPVVRDLWCCGDRPQSGDTYGRGETLKAEVMFSEAVTVTGTPQLTLTIGSATRTVDLDYVWDDGEGLVFEYEVQSDDLDTDGISIEADALSLNGATIQDSAGNPADLDLSEHVISNEINDGNHKVDGSIDHPPVVEWAGVDSEPQSGDTYGVGEPTCELVTVTGTPQLELIGTATRTVDLNRVGRNGGGVIRCRRRTTTTASVASLPPSRTAPASPSAVSTHQQQRHHKVDGSIVWNDRGRLRILAERGYLWFGVAIRGSVQRTGGGERHAAVGVDHRGDPQHGP